MAKDASIRRYSADELAARRRKGESRTDWDRVDAQRDDFLEASVARDPDAGDVDIDWSTVEIGLPKPKRDIHMKVDADVLEWFKAQGKGYQTRMNAILRAFYEQRR